jgi:hypothetical protein
MKLERVAWRIPAAAGVAPVWAACDQGLLEKAGQAGVPQFAGVKERRE